MISKKVNLGRHTRMLPSLYLAATAPRRSKIAAMRHRPNSTIPPLSSPKFADQGFVKLKTVLALLLLGVAGFIISRVAPPYFANMQLTDKIRDEAKFAQANNRTAEQVRGNILRKALLLEIPLQGKDIRIHISFLNPAWEPSDVRHHLYSCGYERDEDALEGHTPWVRDKISHFSSLSTLR